MAPTSDTSDSDYERATIQSFNPIAGYGYVEPDAASASPVLVHQHSLRTPHLRLHAGDRVLFKTSSIPRGLLATDVHIESDSGDELFQDNESIDGVVESTTYERGYGFIRTTDNRRVFFHLSNCINHAEDLKEGTSVTCRLTDTPKGTEARDVSIAQTESQSNDKKVANRARSRELAALASLARESGKHAEAMDYYERALREAPSLQLFLSYAAMERSRRRPIEAAKIYDNGIRLFPTTAKLREDAGALAITMGHFARAERLLVEALELCRRHNQPGEKGVLLALARLSYKLDTINSLQQAVRYYETALKLFGRQGRPPQRDLFQLNIAKIRTQHHRGNLTVQFLRNTGFEIVWAELLDQTTVGCDFIVRTEDAEFTEGYGLNGDLLVRCMFKTDTGHADIDDLNHVARDLGQRGQIHEGVVLLVVSSLPDSLQRVLFNRIENHQSAIVPIPQALIETSAAPTAALRTVLDQWLYKRDLFAQGFPVVGRHFFGREKPLAELRDSIRTGTPAGVFGLRKVGKTSLLKETERRANEFGDIVVYMDLLRIPTDVTNTRWLYWKLAELLKSRAQQNNLGRIKWRLAGQFADFLDIPASFPVATAFDSDLTSLLKEVDSHRVTPKPRVVLLLDEIERLLPNHLGKTDFEGYFDFFSYFRGVAQESSNFVLIVTGANPAVCEAAQFGGRDNPVFNFFREIYLQLLERNECATMIRGLSKGMGLRFSESAVKIIYKLTGGHPYFARQLCSFIATRYLDRPLQVTDDMINSQISHYLEVAGKDFSEILERLLRDYPSERDVCLRLARESRPVRLESVMSESNQHTVSLRHLQGYQIITIQDGQIELSMDLLRQWLKRKYVSE